MSLAVSSTRRVTRRFVLAFVCFAAANVLGQVPSAPDAAAKSAFAELRDGTVSGNVYHNVDMGFRYEFPAGWVVDDKADQSRAIAAEQQFVWTDDMAQRRSKGHMHCSKDLLFVSRFPEGMRVDGFNSFAFVIAADPQCLPGVSFPASVKDREAIQKIAGNLGTYFKAANTTSVAPGRVRAFETDGRVMLEVSQSYRSNTYQTGTSTFQSIDSFVWIMKADKYWIMLMFAGADAADLHKLRQTKLFFDSGPK